MSKEARQWAERLALPDPSMKAVLLQLAYMHRAGGKLFPSQKSLAEKTGLSDRAVWEALKLLEAFALLVRQPRSNGYRGRTSDVVELQLSATAPISKAAIKLARKGLRNSLNVRSAARDLQLAPGSGGTRSTSEGIGELLEEPNQGSTKGSIGHCTREADDGRPTLKVLAGGKS